MICIEEKQHARYFLWKEQGGKEPVEIVTLDAVVLRRLAALKERRVGERIEGCGSRLTNNVYLIYEDNDYVSATC